MRVLDCLAHRHKQFEALARRQPIVVAELGTPFTKSMTKKARPVSVVPASVAVGEVFDSARVCTSPGIPKT